MSESDGTSHIIEVYEPGHESYRIFPAIFYPLVWDRSYNGCYYAGDSQGGPEISRNPMNSVIEGHYTQYSLDGPFDTEYLYSQFDAAACSTDSVYF